MGGERRSNRRDRDRDDEGGRGRRRGFPRKGKRCQDCDYMDFKDLQGLSRFCTNQGKLQGRKRNNACAKCQGLIKAAVKRARFMALMPYVG